MIDAVSVDTEPCDRCSVGQVDVASAIVEQREVFSECACLTAFQ